MNPSYWRALAILLALTVAGLWWRSFAADQRAADVQIAALAARGVTPTSAPPVTVPFPNPLLDLGLSNQAAWVVGSDPATGELWPARSAFVVTELLRTLDLCGTWVGIDAAGVLFVSTVPVPGSFPLVQGCDASATTTTTVKPGGA